MKWEFPEKGLSDLEDNILLGRGWGGGAVRGGLHHAEHAGSQFPDQGMNEPLPLR